MILCDGDEQMLIGLLTGMGTGVGITSTGTGLNFTVTDGDKCSFQRRALV